MLYPAELRALVAQGYPDPLVTSSRNRWGRSAQSRLRSGLPTPGLPARLPSDHLSTGSLDALGVNPQDVVGEADAAEGGGVDGDAAAAEFIGKVIGQVLDGARVRTEC